MSSVTEGPRRNRIVCVCGEHAVMVSVGSSHCSEPCGEAIFSVTAHMATETLWMTQTTRTAAAADM